MMKYALSHSYFTFPSFGFIIDVEWIAPQYFNLLLPWIGFAILEYGLSL